MDERNLSRVDRKEKKTGCDVIVISGGTQNRFEE